MRIGIVCPYSFDVPGGVQFHVRDLAEHLIGQGDHVSVLAPADEDTPLPPYIVSSGKALPVTYNGSVARLTFGPVAAARTARWLETGAFDVIHVHEPIAPSVSILALWQALGPIAATFHTSYVRSRAVQVAYPMVRSSLEKITGRIAVSEAARQTVITHLGGDAVVIPNGVFAGRFAAASPSPEWVGTPERPTIAFLGRIDEPRKGLPVLSAALPAVVAALPGLRVLVAGYGDVDAARAALPAGMSDRVEFLGGITDAQKASLLRSVDAYVAPHTGGESFGIVLVEALAAGAPVLASDIPAFANVLRPADPGDGLPPAGLVGETFRNGDTGDLAAKLVALLGDPVRRTALSQAGMRAAARYDWGRVAMEVRAVYETVVDAGRRVGMVGVHPDAVRPLSRYVRTTRQRRGFDAGVASAGER